MRNARILFTVRFGYPVRVVRHWCRWWVTPTPSPASGLSRRSLRHAFFLVSQPSYCCHHHSELPILVGVSRLVPFA